MNTIDTHHTFYRALVNKDPAYDGVFYVGVTTTGVFCRPTCPARKPKFEHCEFFPSASQALLASYRPCKRCRPLSHPQEVSATVQRLVDAIESHPDKRWNNRDFERLSVHASTARRQFRKRFGMTFVQYARARRMGIALEQIRKGQAIIDAQLAAGYESSSGFRDAFTRLMQSPPTRGGSLRVLQAKWLDTALGPMVAIADDESLYLLEFVDRRGLEREMERLRQKTRTAAIIPGDSLPLSSIAHELNAYFHGNLAVFQTPIRTLGTPFEQKVWDELITIPAGQTRSYGDIARTVGQPTACRAVARANGANSLAIVIPCHRVIKTNGDVGGYGGGSERKRWLLDHEKKARQPSNDILTTPDEPLPECIRVTDPARDSPIR